MISKYRTR